MKCGIVVIRYGLYQVSVVGCFMGFWLYIPILPSIVHVQCLGFYFHKVE
jgi:hypothetical protein